MEGLANGHALPVDRQAPLMAIRKPVHLSAMDIGMAVRSAFAQATSRIYWLTVAIVILATALSARVPELPLRTTHDRASGEGNVGTGQPPQ